MVVQNKIEEIEYFNKVAGADFGLDDEVYEDLLKIARIGNWENSKRVLDAGCGTGGFGRRLAARGHKVIGVDISSEMIKVANSIVNSKQITAHGEFRAIVGDLENASLFEKDSFDVILCGFILHHFPNPSKVISNINFWLKPSGVVVIIEPNGSNPINILSKLINKLLRVIIRGRAAFLSTSNETNHTHRCYLNYFNRMRFKTSLLIKSYLGPYKPLVGKHFWNFLIFIRSLLYAFTWLLLPEPYRRPILIIITQKIDSHFHGSRVTKPS